MKYPVDITNLVTDLAETPGVHAVEVRRVDFDRLLTASLWPSKYRATEQILLHENHCLFVEGEWQIPDDQMFPKDFLPLLNALRKDAGLDPIYCIAESFTGTYKRTRVWSGYIQIGFPDDWNPREK
jgi:hypothetical protein